MDIVTEDPVVGIIGKCWVDGCRADRRLIDSVRYLFFSLRTGRVCFSLIRMCWPMAMRARARTFQFNGLALLPNVCPVGMKRNFPTLKENSEDMSGLSLTHLNAELTSSSHRRISYVGYEIRRLYIRVKYARRARGNTKGDSFILFVHRLTY